MDSQTLFKIYVHSSQSDSDADISNKRKRGDLDPEFDDDIDDLALPFKREYQPSPETEQVNQQLMAMYIEEGLEKKILPHLNILNLENNNNNLLSSLDNCNNNNQAYLHQANDLYPPPGQVDGPLVPENLLQPNTIGCFRGVIISNRNRSAFLQQNMDLG